MRRFVHGNRLTSAFLALGGLLIFILLGEILLLKPAAVAMNQSPVESGTRLPAGSNGRFMPAPRESYPEILSRPLLFEDRRMPPEAEIAREPVKAKTPLRLKLEGVAISSSSKVALLRDLGNNRLLQLSEGMSHDEWILDSVTSGSAVFRRDDEIEVLALETEHEPRQRR